MSSFKLTCTSVYFLIKENQECWKTESWKKKAQTELEPNAVRNLHTAFVKGQE